MKAALMQEVQVAWPRCAFNRGGDCSLLPATRFGAFLVLLLQTSLTLMESVVTAVYAVHHKRLTEAPGPCITTGYELCVCVGIELKHTIPQKMV